MAGDYAANEAFVRDAVARGDIADFTQIPGYNAEQKPNISAAFLRRLMLGLEQDADGKIVKPLLPGVRIKGAFLAGALDLADCAGAGGAGLPALALEACDLPHRIDLSHARLARFSLKDSRFRELWGAGLRLDGDFDFVRTAPAPSTIGGDDTAYIRLGAARIGGDIWGRGARLCAPNAIPDGMEVKPHAFNVQASSIAGPLILDDGFSAQGCVWLLGAKIGGTLQCGGGRFANADGHALVAADAEIGGAVLLRAEGEQRFEAEGAVSLHGAKIGRSLDCHGGRFANAGGEALNAVNAEIGGAVLLRANGEQRFEAEGAVSLYGARVGRDFELRDAALKHQGWALVLRTARIDGQLVAEDNEIAGGVDLAGLRVGNLLDDPDTAWGDPKVGALVDLNEIDLDKIGAPENAPRPLWRARAGWLRRNTGQFMGVKSSKFSNQPWRQVAAAFERAGLRGDARRIRREEQREINQHRGDSIGALRTRFYNRDLAKLPPWRQAVFVLTALASYPFVFVSAKLSQFFVWLFAEKMFGYGLSVSRAAATVALVWLVGTLGVWVMQERGALVAAQAPDKPALACEHLQPPLYALDVMLPVLDLKQESACLPGFLPGGAAAMARLSLTLAPEIALGPVRTPAIKANEVDVWNWLKALFSILGAAVAGFALLTWTGVFRPRAE